MTPDAVHRHRGALDDAELAAAFLPVLVVTAERGRGEDIETRRYLVRPELGVEVAEADEEYHLVPFDPEELVDRLAGFLPLAAAPAPASEPVVVDLETAPEAEGLPDALAAAIEADDWCGARVECLHRTPGARIEGGELAWIHCGDAGVWAIDAGGDQELTLLPVSVESLASELLDYLPGTAA